MEVTIKTQDVEQKTSLTPTELYDELGVYKDIISSAGIGPEIVRWLNSGDIQIENNQRFRSFLGIDNAVKQKNEPRMGFIKEKLKSRGKNLDSFKLLAESLEKELGKPDSDFHKVASRTNNSLLCENVYNWAADWVKNNPCRTKETTTLFGEEYIELPLEKEVWKFRISENGKYRSRCISQLYVYGFIGLSKYGFGLGQRKMPENITVYIPLKALETP
ncbi:MAG: hypothetical protein KAI53_03325 [Candidatus Aenigmarchaeota archaeon]|nr:hypothetical protein [Candidatus Aenigmarchaeota archaeon]